MSEEKKDGISPVATAPSIDVQQYTKEELDAERKIVLRKIDWVIMPIV
jgi:hypothetical protein